MNIIVRSAVGAYDYIPTCKWAAIQIGDRFVPQLNQRLLVASCQLLFRDDFGGHHKSFNDYQAKRICDFVEKYEKGIDTLLIHCTMGKSRSPAVAQAISEVFGWPNDLSGDIFPNPHVRNVMRKVAQERWKNQQTTSRDF